MKVEAVRAWMKEQDVKPEELALKLGVTYPTVMRFFQTRRLSLSTIKLLERIMGKPEGFLNEDKETPKSA